MSTRSGIVLKRSRFKIRWNTRHLVVQGTTARLYNEMGAELKRELVVVVVASVPSSFWTSRHAFCIYDSVGACIEFACEASSERDAWVDFLNAQMERAQAPAPPPPAVRAAARRVSTAALAIAASSRTSSARTSLAAANEDGEGSNEVAFVSRSRARLSMISALSAAGVDPRRLSATTESALASDAPSLPAIRSARGVQGEFESAVEAFDHSVSQDAGEVAHWLAIAAALRRFQTRAVECAQRLVDEYTLPTQYKTIRAVAEAAASTSAPPAGSSNAKSSRRLSVASPSSSSVTDEDADWQRMRSDQKSGSTAHPEDGVYLVCDSDSNHDDAGAQYRPTPQCVLRLDCRSCCRYLAPRI